MSMTNRALFAVTALGLLAGTANAKPPFAEKEGVKCTYCHTQPPQRNYRGNFYKANNLAFAGFDDAAEAKKAGVEVGPDADSKPKSMTAPAGGGEAKPEAPAGPSIDALKAAAAKAEAAAAKAPKDKKLAAAAGKALAELGHAQMMDQSVPPRLRYPQALATLRKAVKVDATNKAAAADIKAIEDAYKSMGRPVPKS